MTQHHVRTSQGSIEIEQSHDHLNVKMPTEGQNQLTRDEARQLGERLLDFSKGSSSGQSGGSQSPSRS